MRRDTKSREASKGLYRQGINGAGRGGGGNPIDSISSIRRADSKEGDDRRVWDL